MKDFIRMRLKKQYSARRRYYKDKVKLKTY